MLSITIAKAIVNHYMNFLNNDFSQAWMHWDDEWKEYEQQELIKQINNILIEKLNPNTLTLHSFIYETASIIFDAIFIFEKNTSIEEYWISLDKDIKELYKTNLINSFTEIIQNDKQSRKNIIF
jgi:hypothetical protein